jgi:hypothetical protein
MIAPLLQSALAHNEMVRAYEHAGFTRAEAIQITTTILTEGQRTRTLIEAETRKQKAAES